MPKYDVSRLHSLHSYLTQGEVGAWLFFLSVARALALSLSLSLSVCVCVCLMNKKGILLLIFGVCNSSNVVVVVMLVVFFLQNRDVKKEIHFDREFFFSFHTLHTCAQEFFWEGVWKGKNFFEKRIEERKIFLAKKISFFLLFTPQKTVHGKFETGLPQTTTRGRTTLSSPWSVGCAADKNMPADRGLTDGAADQTFEHFFCFAIHNYPLSFYPPLSDDPNSALDDAKSELFTFCASQKTKIKFLGAEKRMQRRKSLSSRVQTAENMRDLKRERWMHASGPSVCTFKFVIRVAKKRGGGLSRQTTLPLSKRQNCIKAWRVCKMAGSMSTL